MGKIQYIGQKDNSRLARANFLLTRWGFLIRRGLPNLGYPSRSPEQQLLPSYGGDYIELAEDSLTAQIINHMTLPMRNIARLHWSNGLKQSEIARRENLKRGKVRARILFIKQAVADQVLY